MGRCRREPLPLALDALTYPTCRDAVFFVRPWRGEGRPNGPQALDGTAELADAAPRPPSTPAARPAPPAGRPNLRSFKAPSRREPKAGGTGRTLPTGPKTHRSETFAALALLASGVQSSKPREQRCRLFFQQFSSGCLCGPGNRRIAAIFVLRHIATHPEDVPVISGCAVCAVNVMGQCSVVFVITEIWIGINHPQL